MIIRSFLDVGNILKLLILSSEQKTSVPNSLSPIGPRMWMRSIRFRLN